ncbi:MAG: hypothetical protein CME70_11255 [Halobacteriovorax sp.]|nr:hypothetical protein [Halobacteriovorax sp.]|tara:strand:+ start:100370 stop:100906 length:537 start_codon:yes stop_codon:yes gene_type:complete
MLLRVIKILILISALSSCVREKGELKFKDNTLPFKGSLLVQGKAPLSFNSLQKYILKPKCMSCHSTKAGRIEPENDPIDFDSYETTMIDRFIPLLKKGLPEKSRLYETVESGEMPIRGRLHDKEIKFIANWIKACAPKEEVTTIPENCEEDGDDDDDDFDNDDFDEDNEEDDFDNDEF